MKLACALTSDNISVETYHNPNIGLTWERVAHSRDGISSWPVWLLGRTGRQRQTRDRMGLIILEKRRGEIIAETRARVTRAERVNTIWVILMAGQSVPDAANILPIINSYLLACYPAIIPEDIATVESWIPQFGPYALQKSQYDFSGVRPGRDKCSIKTRHINEECEHIDCGYAVINGERVVIEKCSLYRSCVYFPTGGVTVLLGAYVSRLISERREI